VAGLMASRMGEHRGWTIRVTPHEKAETWTAIVAVWPPRLDHRTPSLYRRIREEIRMAANPSEFERAFSRMAKGAAGRSPRSDLAAEC
jgi:hypothetical protein